MNFYKMVQFTMENKLILLRNKIRWEINHSDNELFILKKKKKLRLVQEQINKYHDNLVKNEKDKIILLTLGKVDNFDNCLTMTYCELFQKLKTVIERDFAIINEKDKYYKYLIEDYINIIEKITTKQINDLKRTYYGN